jgi:hypothetical protein
MMVRSSLAALALVTVFASAAPSDVGKPGNWAAVEPGPDPRLARPLGRWPNAADLARLRSVEGRPKAVLLRVLGHPSEVWRRPDGAEVWDYPWPGVCWVWVRNGACTDTLYFAGY